MGVLGQQVRVELGFAAQLHDALGQFVGMFQFLVGVLQELIGGDAGFQAAGHEVVALVAQHADQFGGQRLIEQTQDLFAVGAVAFGHRAVFHILACPFAKGAYVRQMHVSHFNLLRLIRFCATLSGRDRSKL